MSGEHPPDQPELDNALVDPLTAQLVVDSVRILHHPAIQPLIDLDMEAGESLGQTKLFAQQYVLNYMLVQGAIGNYADMSTQELMDNQANNAVLNLTLRGASEFNSVFTAYARAQDKTGQRQAGDIISGNVADNVTLAVQDLATLYQRGLIDAEGNSENLQYAGRVLRFLTVNVLFSDQLAEPGFIDRFYDQLYETVVGEASNEGRLNAAARDYARQYGEAVTRGNVIQSMRRKAGPLVGEITNRAALQVLLANARGSLAAVRDVEDVKYKYSTALRAIGLAPDIPELNTSIVDLLGRLEQAAQDERSGFSKDGKEIAEDIVQTAHLDWEVLPPGELEERAHGIVDAQAAAGKELTIDLERLKILANIRKQWGEQASYYAYGKLGKRGVIRRDGQEEPDQYLLLILQDLDDQGGVVQEFAVAESPIAGPNALYVFRQDVSEGLSWREVMALPKSYARALKARRVKHSQPRHAPEGYLIPAMTEKVRLLLACEPQEFLAIEFSGERGYRLPKAAAGDVAGDQ